MSPRAACSGFRVNRASEGGRYTETIRAHACAVLFLGTQPGVAVLPGRSPRRRARKQTDSPCASGWASAGLHESCPFGFSRARSAFAAAVKQGGAAVKRGATKGERVAGGRNTAYKAVLPNRRVGHPAPARALGQGEPQEEKPPRVKTLRLGSG